MKLRDVELKECEACGDDFPPTSPNQKYCLPCSHALRGVSKNWRKEVKRKLKGSKDENENRA